MSEEKKVLSNSKKRRSNLERVEAIFQYIDDQNGTFPKSRLKEIGLSSTAAENWLDIIEFIQSRPKIRLVKTENTTLIEIIEGKYQTLIRNKLTDDRISFEQRKQFGEDYIRSLNVRERAGIGKQPHNPHLFKESTTREEYFGKIKQISSIISQINPIFKNFHQNIVDITETMDEDEQGFELAKEYKNLIKNNDLETILNEIKFGNKYKDKIKDITKLDPDYQDKLDKAIKFILAQISLYSKNNS